MEIPTVKIKLGNDDFVIINEDDFDPDQHELFDAPVVPKLEPSKATSRKAKPSQEDDLETF